MMVSIQNLQREAPVDAARVTKLARCAIRRLRIRERGTLAITFIGTRRMQMLNKRFLHHDRPTDVLSFRYDNAEGRRPKARIVNGLWPQASGLRPIIGEILIAPQQARAYAARHKIPYREELSRYVVHGLLHWLGRRDGTPQEQMVMRKQENALLARCGVLSDIRHETSDRRPKLRRRSHVSGLMSQV